MARFEKNCLFADTIGDGEPCRQESCKYNKNTTGTCDYSGFIERVTARVLQSMEPPFEKEAVGGTAEGGTNA